MVDDLADGFRGTTEDTSALELKDWQTEEILRHLSGCLFRAYHCTRLLDHEVEAVRAHGLRPLSPELILERLDGALEAGCIDLDQRNRLLTGNALRTRSTDRRAGQVCLLLFRRAFDEEPGAVGEFLDTWGGEGINFTSVGGELKDRLLAIGQPSIVVANIALLDGSRRHRVHPNLAKLFVGAALGLEGLGADVIYRAPVPPEHIVDIWQPAHPEYDRHDRLPGHNPRAGNAPTPVERR